MASASGTDDTVGTVGVVGLGTMGAGIVEVFARNGYAVVGVETGEDALERDRQHVVGSTARAVRRGKLTEDEAAALVDRIHFTTEMSDVKDCTLVVEAVVERVAVKQAVFRALDDVVSADAILATNTSSLSVTEISSGTSHPGRVIGLHFFNPAPVQHLVEVIRTVVTEPEVVERTAELARSLDKTPVVVGDKAGFIANALLFGYLNHAASMFEAKYATREDLDAAMRLGCGYLNHAASMFEAKYATREDLDAAMRLGCGYPMGPLALLDLIGLDTAYEILDTMYKQGRDRLHAPVPVLKQMVTAGLLGRKSGRGFYTYDGAGSPAVVTDALTPSPDDAPRLQHDVRTVGVVGTGTMATGIVEVFAQAGFPVTYVGRSSAGVDALRTRLEASLDRAIQRGRLTESEREQLLSRLTGCTSLEDLGDVDLVVEAVAEQLEVKTTLFESLDEICKSGAILATTTSSLPVIALARVTSRAHDVVGMHFFNPASVMRLVEVVSTVSTGEDVTETVRALCARIGKVAVSCGDRAGFIVNALLFPYLNDAVKMLEAHYATADDIDTAMKHGCALPMGPFELLDVVGNDVSLAIQRELYLEFREPGFAPAPLLEHLVTAGYLGRKSGRGFRDHSVR